MRQQQEQQQRFQYDVFSQGQGLQDAAHSRHDTCRPGRLPLQEQEQVAKGGIRLVDQHHNDDPASRLAAAGSGRDGQSHRSVDVHVHQQQSGHQAGQGAGQHSAPASDGAHHDQQLHQQQDLQVCNQGIVTSEGVAVLVALQGRGGVMQVLRQLRSCQGLWSGLTVCHKHCRANTANTV